MLQLVVQWTHDVAGRWPATSWVHYTTSCNIQSSVPEDGQNNCPKHVEMTGIINKPLLLHLVGCLYYFYFIIFFWDLLNNLNLTLILKTGEYGDLLIMPANGRWDLIRRLKVKKNIKIYIRAALTFFSLITIIRERISQACYSYSSWNNQLRYIGVVNIVVWPLTLLGHTTKLTIPMYSNWLF